MGEINTGKEKAINRTTSATLEPWQVVLSKSTDRWLYVWNNKLFTDVAFSVGFDEEVIECHKILLVLHSPVFETMFGQRWQSKEIHMQTISLPDEEMEIFKFFLEFVYTGSFSTSDIDKLISVLVLGKKYMCNQLIKKCIEQLTDALTVQNVMQIYQVAELMDEPDLNKATEEYILHNANSLFTSGKITKINKTDLGKILKNDELNVAEIDLFNAVYSWGRGECLKMNGNPDDSSFMYDVLKDVIPLIRFTNMSPEDFSLQVVPKNILPLEDTVTIFR
ncbi:BTB/POZ domain-containing protein 2 [Folsomia candida]|uniref:BTB/POZ domain-containing protein 2 n=2 Tax=Folsomia candida TaxID=158441 RepID=A0A226EHX2_FOLCA|nr:BTB/POZ domain-containing protein 2 [Folsomia candida]